MHLEKTGNCVEYSVFVVVRERQAMHLNLIWQVSSQNILMTNMRSMLYVLYENNICLPTTTVIQKKS
jgi:hypothetical protein